MKAVIQDISKQNIIFQIGPFSDQVISVEPYLFESDEQEIGDYGNLYINPSEGIYRFEFEGQFSLQKEIREYLYNSSYSDEKIEENDNPSLTEEEQIEYELIEKQDKIDRNF